MSDPRHYTGDFPPGGPATIDDLVVALADSVERVRIKLGAAVQILAEELNVDPSEALSLVDPDWAMAVSR